MGGGGGGGERMQGLQWQSRHSTVLYEVTNEAPALNTEHKK